MKTSTEIKNITGAMIKAHAKINHATKDAQNPHFKNHYATLESVIDASKQILLDNKIIVLQTVSAENVLLTTLVHETGEYFESEIKLLLNKQDMQQFGSALTYARRYALSSILNMAQEDDDGDKSAEIVLGDYVMQNSNLKGKALKNIKLDELQKYITDSDKWYKDQGKAPYGTYKDDISAVKKYLEEQK